MTLRHRLDPLHVVSARLREPPELPPYLATIRAVMGHRVPGAIDPADVPDWLLVGCTLDEAITLATAGLAPHCAPEFTISPPTEAGKPESAGSAA